MKYYKSKKYPIELVLSEKIEKTFTSHNHVEHFVISLLLAGRAKVCINSVTREYEQNEVFIVLPYIIHSVQQERDTKILSLCIEKNFLKENSLTELKCLIHTKLLEIQEVFINSEQAEKLLSAIELLYKMAIYDAADFTNDIANLADEMHETSEREWNLDALAKESSISKFYLIRKFKNQLGMTPHQYIIQNRVRKAQQLLNEGTSIVDATLETSFYDQSHFSKSFSKIVGITPSAYVNSIVELS